MSDEPSDAVTSARRLRPGQRCIVSVFDVDGAREDVLVQDRILLEAPNWTRDGRALILNGDGRLWRLDLRSRALEDITPPGVPGLNNDHVLSPDGEHIYLSADDGHIHRARLEGGSAVRITRDPGMFHFLHGVSPDGDELAFVGIARTDDGAWPPGAVWTHELATGKTRRRTAAGIAADGSEYSPDGEWILLNTEEFDGHAQIARLRRDGTGLEQLTVDERVNWFPHVAPDGHHAVYLAFPPGTAGHPADLPVELKIVVGGDWRHPVRTIGLSGGQGTINVNSWCPDSTRFAAVDYPIG